MIPRARTHAIVWTPKHDGIPNYWHGGVTWGRKQEAELMSLSTARKRTRELRKGRPWDTYHVERV